METRLTKRVCEAMKAEEAQEEVVDETNKDNQTDVEEVPVRLKKKKLVKYSPKKLMSPTGALELAKLKEQAKVDQHKIKHLEDRIKYLEEANRDLKNDKDFLLSQIKGASNMPGSTGKGSSKAALELTSTSTSPCPSSESSFSSSSEEEEQKKKKKKKAKKSKKHLASHSRSRMTTTDGVIRRYKNALHIFNKYGSMKRAFAKINVDRNTIARTAAIAELAITFPDTFKELLPQDEANEKMSVFAERCREAITEEMAGIITAKKKIGKLLPIMYKYT
ncbi:coiled-coil domain-containing protein 106-like [Melanotaenia boesemani]|uniref:coiled-coil domain-containing protein 106-like n=1 Tax=Melanotaenia boesemani TaxID=1250792 RepID=UPI001C046A61|nr:coiled-coil domain-containing protein 106-like [Melanotaenia boesemani]XP_041836153.1 coiled-coil domain-containing protein 106-like [Melanotaenia boesemani]XP_041836162.1 coiled-coil domain-containing protein 106-like [Melanotaenia boesemani]XP_041836174.1 coiled-coil domain-containing protein 106-like [Melanotaenia boesemani]XP_041853899.1 coiled-coil domain-containing protein 106-like [Melanotaenia boesemani]XP_041853900.1 coiled-coil domain-containing protein 106-like [Melanotaenia boes